MTELAELFGAAVIVPDAGHCEVPAAFERFGEMDRGSYEFVRDVAVPPSLVALAARATGRSLAVESSRVLRLRAGDYVLAHHDLPSEGNPVEITLDLSPAIVPGAEVHYRRRGQVFFRFPSQPGALAIVERGATVTCNHTYVSKLQPNAVVVRLIALLR